MPVDVAREHWWWREAPRPATRAVVVDIDGVLADAQGRQHHLEWRRRDWQAFFDAAGEDPVVREVATLLSLLDATLEILLVTARPIRIRETTLRWLAEHRLRWDLLVMRPRDELAPAVEFKREVVDELEGEGFTLELALDDDPLNRDMYVEAGVPCLYIHSGYYD
jgi:hypothetical protein